MHSSKRLLLKALAAVSIAATLTALAGCTSVPSNDKTAPTTFTMVTSSSGVGPDFSNYSSLQLFTMYQAVYDYPMHYDPSTAKLTPWAVTKWAYDKAQTVLTLDVRKGMEFADGKPVNAAALKANFDQRITLLDAGFNYTNVSSVDTPSDSQVVIHLKSPDYFFIQDVANTHIAEPGSLTSKDSPMGSGPYVLDKKQTVVNSSYVFTRNPHYWDPKAYAFDTVTVKVMADVTARVNALVSGQVDYAPIDANTAKAAGDRGFKVFKNQATSAVLLPFDRAGTLVPALGNVKVRQALEYAIDRNTVAKTIDHGDGNASDQYFVKGMPWYVPDAGKYTYDPAKAKQLLAEAGYPNGFDIGDVPSLFAPEYEPAVKQYLADVGVKINFVSGSLEKQVPDLVAGKVPAGVWNDGLWLPVNEIEPTGVWNPLHYTTPEYDALLKQFNGGTPDQVKQAAADMGKYMYDNAWFIQVGHPASYFAANTKKVDVKLAGLQAFSGFDGIYLWDIKPAA